MNSIKNVHVSLINHILYSIFLIFLTEEESNKCIHIHDYVCSLERETSFDSEWQVKIKKVDLCNTVENTEKEVKKKAKTEPTKYRQYQEEYVLMGFTSTSCNPPQALYFFCREKLANSWHLSIKH